MVIQQIGQNLRFSVFYTASGIAKTGLAPGSVLTVDVLRPDGTSFITGASPVEDGAGWYHYDVPAISVTGGYTGVWVATFKSTDVTCDQRHLGEKVLVGPSWATNLDTTMSSRGTLTAAGVWGYSSRKLTDYGTVLSTPVATPTVSVTGGGSTGGLLAAGAYYLKYTYTNPAGETPAGPESTLFTVSAGNIPRVALPSLPTGATAINIYLTQAAGASGTETLYVAGVMATTYDLSIAHTAGQQPPPTVNSTNSLITSIWGASTRTLSAFGFNVTVGSNSDKTGYALAATGLDSIAVTDPGAVASHTSLPKMIVAVYRYFYRKTTATTTQLKTYAENGSTVNVTMALSNDGTTQTKGTAT